MARAWALMPTFGDVAQIVLSLVTGMGAGSLLRAWGQNRNEHESTLTDEQKQFRESQHQEIVRLDARNEYLRGRLDAIDTRNAELVQANAELRAKVEIQEVQIERFADQLTVSFAAREKLTRTMAVLEQKVRIQEGEIASLHEQIEQMKRRRDPNARTRSTDPVDERRMLDGGFEGAV